MKNNKFIAEFMGLPLVPCNIGTENGVVTEGYQHPKVDVPCTADGLQYKYSWDWLMPVVEKIESLDIVSFEKNLQEEGDYQALFTKGDDILICHYADTSIEATYKAVVEFIKQYK